MSDHYTPLATGLTVYAYPSHLSLADWTTNRVQMVEAAAPNLGRYTADLTAHPSWRIFHGSSQPGSWNEAKGILELIRSDDRDGVAIAKATELALVKAKTDNLPASPAAVGSAMTLTSGERTSIAAAVWGALTSGLSAAGSIGKLIVDNLNAAVGTLTPATIWAYSSRTLTGGTAVAVSPIDSSDNISIYQGTDYAPAIGTTLSWSKSGYPAAAWETGATGVFHYQLTGSTDAVAAGTVAIEHDGDATLTATVTLTDVETEAMTRTTESKYEVFVTTSGGLIRLLAFGILSVTSKLPDPE